MGLRSNFGSNIVNQFRYAQLAGWLGGSSDFFLVGGTEFFDQTQRGYTLGLGVVSGITIRNAFSSRSSPTRDFTDNVTWVTGNHTFTFGGQLKKIETISDSVSPIVSTVTFGYAGDLQDTALRDAISATTIPGISTADLANARALYSTLTGRISGFNAGTVRLGADGRYVLNGSRHFEIAEETNGLFAQDSWRIKPNLTITGGVRWQPQLGAKLNSANYAILTNPDMAWDVTGPGNYFGGPVNNALLPTFRLNEIGERAFRNDLNNFAPSIGVVWSPDFAGWVGKVFGRSGAIVIRGGFSR
jgi:hypothetical protein